MLVQYRKAESVEQNSVRIMQAEIIQTRDYNVASEAYLQCPNCTRKPQRIRTTRKHIERDHAEKVTFECILKVDVLALMLGVSTSTKSVDMGKLSMVLTMYMMRVLVSSCDMKGK